MAKVEVSIPAITVNQLELAEYLGLSNRRVYTLTQEGVLSRDGTRYNLVESIAAYVAYKVKVEATPRKDAPTGGLNQVREEQIRRRMKIEARELIPLSEAVLAMDTVTGDFLTTISSLPVQITRDLDERKRIEKVCDFARGQLEKKFAERSAALQAGRRDDEDEVDDAA